MSESKKKYDVIIALSEDKYTIRWAIKKIVHTRNIIKAQIMKDSLETEGQTSVQTKVHHIPQEHRILWHLRYLSMKSTSRQYNIQRQYLEEP